MKGSVQSLEKPRQKKGEAGGRCVRGPPATSPFFCLFFYLFLSTLSLLFSYCLSIEKAVSQIAKGGVRDKKKWFSKLIIHRNT